MLMIAGEVSPSSAIKMLGVENAYHVEVAEINTRVLSDLADVTAEAIEGPICYGHYRCDYQYRYGPPW